LRLRRFLNKGGWNLIGSDVNFSLADVKFIASDGTEYTWANAIANNKVQAYLAYYDSSPATASSRKYKYVATSDLGMDDTHLRQGKGYWLYANEAGNITLPGVGGTYSNATYAWNKLRFWNGSDEKNVTDAHDSGWIFGSGVQGYINYWDAPLRQWKEVSDSDEADSTTLESWRGYFIYSNVDNLTLIRQN